MVGLVRDLPDWAVGILIACLGWFMAAYMLAPRAMEAEASEKVVPSCLEKLEAEQERALAEATERAEEERNSKISELKRLIARKESSLREVEALVSQYRQMSGLLRQNGLGFVMPDVSGSLPTQEELDALRAEVRDAKRILANIPEINLPRMPSGELMETCTCAAMETLGSRRTAYAVYLASFRQIAPQSMSNIKSDVANILRWDACGDKPWEAL